MLPDELSDTGLYIPQTGARALPLLPPPLPRAGVGVNQSWLTADMWFDNTSPQAGGNQSCLTVPLSMWSYDTCQVKKVNPLRQGQGAPSYATLEGGVRRWRGGVGGVCLY